MSAFRLEPSVNEQHKALDQAYMLGLLGKWSVAQTVWGQYHT